MIASTSIALGKSPLRCPNNRVPDPSRDTGIVRVHFDKNLVRMPSLEDAGQQRLPRLQRTTTFLCDQKAGIAIDSIFIASNSSTVASHSAPTIASPQLVVGAQRS